MLAQWTDEVIRKIFAFMYISAYLAYPALLALSLWLWLNVTEVVRIGHCLFIVQYAGLGHRANEHAVRSQIDYLLDLKAESCIDILWHNAKAVIRANCLLVRKLIYDSPALEPKLFENRERCVDRQAIHVHYARLLNYVI